MYKSYSFIRHPLDSKQQTQRTEIHQILHSTGAQAKLTIGQSNDKYEQEADRVADQVMAMPDPKLQRKPEDEEDDGILQTKPLTDQITPLVQRQEETPEEEEPVQTRLNAGTAPEEISAINSGIQSLRRGGRPMSGSERSFFEPRFGADFSGVCVHDNAKAAGVTQLINARAFALGKDVVFGSGQFNSESSQGKKLLAHELTHVLQQEGGKKDSLISRQVQPTGQQKNAIRRVRRKMKKAVTLLQNAGPYLATAGQGELLDEMLTTFKQITAKHIGTIDKNGRRMQLGTPLKLFYTFPIPGQMSKPFEYHIYFDFSLESRGPAAAYFHGPSDYMGFIVVKVPQVKTASIDALVKVLVHEALHLYTHIQKAVQARIGQRAAVMVPSRNAAAILKTSAFSSNGKALLSHFSEIRTFLNNQSHRQLFINKFPASIVNDWTRLVIEESIAYVYQSRVDMAFSRYRTAGTRGPTVNIATGFVHLQFLKNYLTRHWLKDPDDQTAMATQKGRPC